MWGGRYCREGENSSEKNPSTLCGKSKESRSEILWDEERRGRCRMVNIKENVRGARLRARNTKR